MLDRLDAERLAGQHGGVARADLRAGEGEVDVHLQRGQRAAGDARLLAAAVGEAAVGVGPRVVRLGLAVPQEPELLRHAPGRLPGVGARRRAAVRRAVGRLPHQAPFAVLGVGRAPWRSSRARRSSPSSACGTSRPWSAPRSSPWSRRRAGRTRPQSETRVELVRRTASGRRKPSNDGLCLPAAVKQARLEARVAGDRGHAGLGEVVAQQVLREGDDARVVVGDPLGRSRGTRTGAAGSRRGPGRACSRSRTRSGRSAACDVIAPALAARSSAVVSRPRTPIVTSLGCLGLNVGP